MSNRVELAPIASAEDHLLDENTNADMEGIDDGLTPHPSQPSPENDLHPRISPRAGGVGPEDYPLNGSKPEDYPLDKPKPESYDPYGGPIKPRGRRPLDVNLYATKKTVAQGMMDLALLTANANQLRYVLESGASGGFYYFSVVLISLSIVLQLVVGVVLIFVGRYNVTNEDHAQKADRLNNWLVIGVALIFLGRYNVSRPDQVSKAEVLNNWVVLGVFLITAVNVFISAFGIDPVERMDPVLIVDAALQSLKYRNPEETTTIM